MRLFIIFTFSFLGLIINPCFSKVGMWLPPNLQTQKSDLIKEGLRLPISEIYNENGTGLNNAVVLFGKGCTGELISDKGLVLTNHHCGYGTVQGLSNPTHDYFANGFWAMNVKEELACPGLTVTFVRKMENVTDEILNGIDVELSDKSREIFINERIKNLEVALQKKYKLDVNIQPFFKGNQYWASVTETFNDIRLVGFPPNGIGFFGGDTDNWMWPRHNGDFSLFRIYANKNNQPASFHTDNQPYKPKRFFSINAKGYKEGDFTMVYGFPAVTQEYISSGQLKQIINYTDPIRIASRTAKLNVWNKHMEQDRKVFLQYASKKATIANGWKKWQGELKGLATNNVLQLKINEENKFQMMADNDSKLKFTKNIIPQMVSCAGAADSFIKADEYIKECVLGIEAINQGNELEKILQVIRKNKLNSQFRDSLKPLQDRWAGFYKNYDATTDKDLFPPLMKIYIENNKNFIPKHYKNCLFAFKNNYVLWAENLFETSIITDESRFNVFIQNITLADTQRIKDDPAYKLYESVIQFKNKEIQPPIQAYNQRITTLNRQFLYAKMTYNPAVNYYPDANSTLRLTYGKVKGIDPDGPAGYSYQTNLDEIINLQKPEGEFKIPQKLADLYAQKDFGKWADHNKLPVAFIASNHTSGGNSGSPVLNANGELIGTNFDRIWEGTMSDLNFDEKLCRNISVDIRYTLFIIEKFGNAKWLLKEMKIKN